MLAQTLPLCTTTRWNDVPSKERPCKRALQKCGHCHLYSALLSVEEEMHWSPTGVKES